MLAFAPAPLCQFAPSPLMGGHDAKLALGCFVASVGIVSSRILVQSDNIGYSCG